MILLPRPAPVQRSQRPPGHLSRPPPVRPRPPLALGGLRLLLSPLLPLAPATAEAEEAHRVDSLLDPSRVKEPSTTVRFPRSSILCRIILCSTPLFPFLLCLC
jgi:hypothetical protein